MGFLQNVKWKHYINYIVISILGIIFTVMTLTDSFSSPLAVIMLEKILIAVLLSVSLSMVVGFLGELSLGHAGFMCVGAYLGGKASVLLEPMFGNSFLTLFISIAIGGILAAVCGVIIGLPALRLRGDYLAIVTLAFGEIVRSLFMNSSRESFGGSLGLSTPRFDKKYLFIVGFVMVLICLAVIQNIIRSKHGRAITAIRDSEIAARATGINVTKYKLIVFTVSAFFAGIAGVLYSYSNINVQSTNFSYNYSIEILVMVVLGGMGSINGSIIAAVLITYLDIQLQTILTGNLAVLQNFIYAIILILIVIYNNAPGLKNFRNRFNLKNLLAKIVKPVNRPSKDRDDEARWHRVPTKIEIDETLSVKVQRDIISPDFKDTKGDK
ncbi:MAG: branched-chain amino acid ABC transporter permease [Clostridia bacterium]|nr:branched-chain amino acid ABC transporter permease [Clostridia bacterium]